MADHIEEIEETTVGFLNGHRVPMGNMIASAEYSLPDGSRVTGPVCSLAIDGNVGIFVGAGSVVDVGTDKWKVLQVELSEDDLGSVQLQKLT